VFRLLAERSGVTKAELYQVFNMGVGMVVIVAPQQATAILRLIRTRDHPAWVIGEITQGTGITVLA
jgi:phosphoribosylformylglycinamidine cyclo-ligase